jgi:GNAT superfamily N-acetyltransferase
VITIQRESLPALVELNPLAAAHHAEIGGFSPAYEFDLDHASYHALQEAKMFVSVVARDDGRLIGYWGGMLHSDPHNLYQGRRVRALTGYVLFVSQEHRARIAKRIIATAEEIARSAGIDWIAHPATPGTRAGAFYEALGYRLGEMTYVKCFP